MQVIGRFNSEGAKAQTTKTRVEIEASMTDILEDGFVNSDFLGMG